MCIYIYIYIYMCVSVSVRVCVCVCVCVRASPYLPRSAMEERRVSASPTKDDGTTH